jgi:hypothetical protein
MARRANYGFEKRQKEVKKQQKRDEKAEKKRLRREGGEVEWSGIDETEEGVGGAGDPESDDGGTAA